MASVQMERPAEETILQEHEVCAVKTHTHEEQSKSQGYRMGHEEAKSPTQLCHNLATGHQSQGQSNLMHHHESNGIACSGKCEMKMKDKKEKKGKKEKKDKKEKKEKKDKKCEGKKKEKGGHKKKKDSSNSDSN